MKNKKEVRLIFNLENVTDKKIYDFVSNKSVATAFVKDTLNDIIDGMLVDKKMYDDILKRITSGLSFPNEKTTSNNIEIDINSTIEDNNDFED